MKKALCVLWYAKGTSQAEAMSNTEKIKVLALAIIELCLADSQSVSQSEEIPLN